MLLKPSAIPSSSRQRGLESRNSFPRVTVSYDLARLISEPHSYEAYGHKEMSWRRLQAWIDDYDDFKLLSHECRLDVSWGV